MGAPRRVPPPASSTAPRGREWLQAGGYLNGGYVSASARVKKIVTRIPSPGADLTSRLALAF